MKVKKLVLTKESLVALNPASATRLVVGGTGQPCYYYGKNTVEDCTRGCQPTREACVNTQIACATAQNCPTVDQQGCGTANTFNCPSYFDNNCQQTYDCDPYRDTYLVCTC